MFARKAYPNPSTSEYNSSSTVCRVPSKDRHSPALSLCVAGSIKSVTPDVSLPTLIPAVRPFRQNNQRRRLISSNMTETVSVVRQHLRSVWHGAYGVGSDLISEWHPIAIAFIAQSAVAVLGVLHVWYV
jgi:hypothetical protein